VFMSKRRHELTDEQWQRLEPLLPSQKSKTGHPNLDHRIALNGIIWILRTGAPWRDLPERYDKWQTVTSRFYRWQKAGIWQQVFAQL
jgi:transposase